MPSRLTGFVCLSVVMVTTACLGVWNTLYYMYPLIERFLVPFRALVANYDEVYFMYFTPGEEIQLSSYKALSVPFKVRYRYTRMLQLRADPLASFGPPPSRLESTTGTVLFEKAHLNNR